MDKQEFERVACTICGNKKPHLISKKGQFGLPAFVSICQNDGFVYLNPRWTKERYLQFYSKEYDHYYRPTVFKTETEEEKYSTIRMIASRLQKSNVLNGKSSVLDIGAGMGWSLEFLKKDFPAFNQLMAIEPSEKCLENLKNLDATVIATDIDDDWQKTDIDLIIMRHVLEHFMEPVKVLKKVHDALSDNGVVYIAVPDMMHPKKSLTGHCFRTVHTFYFSKSTLLKVAQMAGLSPVSIHEEDTELWGIFKRAKDKVPLIDLSEVYNNQMLVINKHKLKSFYLDRKQSLKNLVKKIGFK